jgi:RNA polymerase sigma factor (sigma-70 family)
MSTTSETDTTAELARRAIAGDEAAWADLVRRLTPFLYRVARSFGLSTAASGDVVQTAWLRLVEHQGALRSYDAVGAWLATTTRREALAVVRRERATTSWDPEALDVADGGPSVEDDVIRSGAVALLAAAMRRIPARDRQLLTVLSAADGASYADIAAALDIPIGSIGPTRSRALAKLRRELAALGIDGYEFVG